MTVTLVDFGGNLNLDDPSLSSVDGIASAAVLADFNNDQFLDIAVAIPSLDGVAILLNEGGAGDSYTQLPLIDVGEAPSDLLAATLDRGSSIDLAVANKGDDSVSILANDGRGNFSLAQTISDVGDGPAAIAAADFDGGGGIDLAVANGGDNTVRLLINELARAFTLGDSLATGSGPADVAAINLTADSTGPSDLVVVSSGDAQLRTFLNNGSGTLTPGQIVPAGARPVGINPEDLDNDKDLDLVIANDDVAGGGITFALSRGDSTIGSPIHLPLNAPVDSITSADIDNDDDADLAIIVDDPDLGRVVRLLRNDTSEQPGGQIALALLPEVLGQDTNPLIVLSGDVNNDNHDDLVTINGEGSSRRGLALGSVAVQLNGGIGVCRADIVPPGGDGIVNLLDVESVIAAFGLPCDECPQDIAPPPPNGDGQISIADIIAALTSYGPCP